MQKPTRKRNPKILHEYPETVAPNGRKPPWLKVRLPSGKTQAQVQRLMRGKKLHTVCEEAQCPNLAECWDRGTATFLILGDICTRSCGFCAVKRGQPETVDWEEPARVAQAVAQMALDHVVITSVNRDELPDGGAAVFAETVDQIHTLAPGCTVEVLIPDFQGDRAALETVMATEPDVLAHNVETVPRLYRQVRPQARYRRSLEVLRAAKKMAPHGLTKSSVMVGLGEMWDELLSVMQDLHAVDCDILTLGQYLRPTRTHLPVARYYTPDEFAALKQSGDDVGFRWIESGPLVRSSYRAETQVRRFKSARFLKEAP